MMRKFLLEQIVAVSVMASFSGAAMAADPNEGQNGGAAAGAGHHRRASTELTPEQETTLDKANLWIEDLRALSSDKFAPLDRKDFNDTIDMLASFPQGDPRVQAAKKTLSEIGTPLYEEDKKNAKEWNYDFD